jgi:predicted ATPase
MNLSEVPTDKPINILCHHGDVNVVNDRKDVYEITPEKTLEMAEAVTDEAWQQIKQNERFIKRFRLVFPTIDLPDHPLQSHGSGVRHVVGLILLTDMALDTGKQPLWRFPESHLHPSAQLGLADLLIFYTQGRK